MRIQLCQVIKEGKKCGRLARRWKRLEYPMYKGVNSIIRATCNKCDSDPRIAEDLGPIEVTEVAVG